MTTPEWNPNPLRDAPTGDRLEEMRAAVEALGGAVPAPLLRGTQLVAIAREYVEQKPTPVLDLADDQVHENIVMRSIRRHKAPDSFHLGRSSGLHSGLVTFEAQLVQEVSQACLPLIDDIVAGLREQFEEPAAALVTASRKFGFTMRTTSDEVIDLADAKAAAAWRAARPAWAQLDRYHAGMRRLLRVFEVETPTSETAPDLSVYFAAANSWGWDGEYYLERRTDSGMDWFALAAGGLRLNTPGEVVAKRRDRAA
jgi:hypothetical protein